MLCSLYLIFSYLMFFFGPVFFQNLTFSNTLSVGFNSCFVFQVLLDQISKFARLSDSPLSFLI